MSIVKITPKSQRDGSPNADFDCVPTCIAVGVAALTGVWHPPEWWMDTVYGSSYRGGTAASAFVSLAEHLGVHLFAIDGSQQQLDAAIRSELAKGHPVVATEPDWISPNQPTWSHVVLMFADDNTTLSAMDPWNASTDQETDAQWENKFEFHEVWSMEVIPVANKLVVPKGWSYDAAAKVLHSPNGVVVVLGFAQYILQNTWDPQNLPLEKEDGVPGGGTAQLFMDKELRWTAKDGITEASLGGTILLQRQAIAARDTQISAQQKQIDGLLAQLKIAEAGIPPSIHNALVIVMQSMAECTQSIQHALNGAPAPAPTTAPNNVATVTANP